MLSQPLVSTYPGRNEPTEPAKPWRIDGRTDRRAETREDVVSSVGEEIWMEMAVLNNGVDCLAWSALSP